MLPSYDKVTLIGVQALADLGLECVDGHRVREVGQYISDGELLGSPVIISYSGHPPFFAWLLYKGNPELGT